VNRRNLFKSLAAICAAPLVKWLPRKEEYLAYDATKLRHSPIIIKNWTATYCDPYIPSGSPTEEEIVKWLDEFYRLDGTLIATIKT
jgi:hypothetical protein